MLPAWCPETKGLNINAYPRACTTCICKPLNLGILKRGVLACNEILKFLTCALIAPSPSIISLNLGDLLSSNRGNSSRSHLAAEVPAVTTEFSTSPWARSHIYTGLHLCSSESAIYDVAFKL